MDDVGHRWFELCLGDVAEILSCPQVVADLQGRWDRWLSENYPGYTMTGLLAAIETEGVWYRHFRTGTSVASCQTLTDSRARKPGESGSGRRGRGHGAKNPTMRH
jgi:hypothetical protein